MWVQLILLTVFVGVCLAELPKVFTIAGTDYDLECGLSQWSFGKACSRDSKCNKVKYCAVRNVPYARAVRFRRPELLNGTERAERRNGWTNNSTGCRQIDPFSGNVVGSEDCLVVDLYFPEVFFDAADTTKFTLLIIIEGLAMKSYLGPHLKPTYSPIDGDQIYVLAVVHYRVGVLGFLSLENEFAPPNLGLFDQQRALQFLKSSSKELKTNYRVLLGFGSGAACVSLHMANPTSKQLFTRALVFGGSALSPDATVIQPRAHALRLAKYLNCSTTSNETIIHCLNTTDIDKLIEASANSVLSLRFAPFVDGNGTQAANANSDIKQPPIFINGTINKIFSSDTFADNLDLVAFSYSAQAGLNHYVKHLDPEMPEDPIEYLKNFFSEYEEHESSEIGLAKATYQHYFAQGFNLPPSKISNEADTTIDILTDYFAGGPLQSLFLSILRKTTGPSIYSFILPRPSSDEASNFTDFSLFRYLHDTKDKVAMLPGTTDLYGGSLDDLMMFIGCDALPSFVDKEGSIAPALQTFFVDTNLQTLLGCLTYQKKDLATCGNPIKRISGTDIEPGQIVLAGKATPPAKIYRSDHNYFWMSVRPLLMDFERAINRDRDAIANNNNTNVQKAGPDWGLVAGIIVVSLIAVMLALAVVKLVIDRRRGSEASVHFSSGSGTVTTSPE